jgi:hypothetical protein
MIKRREREYVYIIGGYQITTDYAGAPIKQSVFEGYRKLGSHRLGLGRKWGEGNEGGITKVGWGVKRGVQGRLRLP